MKRTILLCLGICSSLLFSACGDKENSTPPPAQLEFENGSKSLKMTIAAGGETQTAPIKSSTSWNVIAPSSAPAHITIAPASGSEGSHTLTVTAAENPGEQPVNAAYQIKGKEGNVITLTIEQPAVEENFYFSLFWDNDKNIGNTYTHEIDWKENNFPLPNLVYDKAWYTDGSGKSFLDPKEANGDRGLMCFVPENTSNKEQTYIIDFYRKDNDRKLGTVTIKQAGKPVEHQLSVDGKTSYGAFDIYTWFGHKSDLNLVSKPAVGFTELEYEYDTLTNGDGLLPVISADKVQIDYKCSENIIKYDTALKISDPNYPDNFVRGSVHMKTVCWLGTLNNGAFEPSSGFTYTVGGRDNWSYTWTDNTSTVRYFRAYYAKDANEFAMNQNALPKYFANSIIPTSEYTLTTEDTDKIAITKFGESQYKIEVKQKIFAKVKITYTCGNFVQHFDLKLSY